MASAPVVSVIVPVHNGESYLPECIDSVLKQTFPHWELVLMDNRSSDATPEICADYAARDARIRAYRATEFVPVSSNYNRGLYAADPRSQYIKFIGCDDWIFPECLERMVALCEANRSVGFVSSYCLEGSAVMHAGLFDYRQTVMPGTEALRRSLVGRHWVTGSFSSLLLRGDLARTRRELLDPGIWHSDTDAAYSFMLKSDVGFVHQVLTFTRLRTDGLTTRFSHRVNSYTPQALRMLLRYGPRVLAPPVFRSELHRMLLDYTSFLARQALKPMRWRQDEFHRFHRYEIEGMCAEAGDDVEVKLVLSMARRLLRPLPSLGPRDFEGGRRGVSEAPPPSASVLPLSTAGETGALAEPQVGAESYH